MILSLFILFFFAISVAKSAPTEIVHEHQRRNASVLFESLMTAIIEGDTELDPPKTNFQAPQILTETETNNDHYPEYAAFALSAYCVRTYKSLDCGESCSSITDTELIYYTGDSAATPNAYVAWSPSLNSVIVAHEGSNYDSYLSIEYDFELALIEPDPKMGVAGKVNYGFHTAWNRTIDDLMPKIQETLDKHSGASITAIGHSLGASIALMDGLYYHNNFPDVSVTTFLFGLPRVGDPDFANSVNDKLGSNVHYVVNNQDPIPHTSPYNLGYSQIPNQIWLPANGTQLFCPGIENANCANSVKTYNISDHNKSYFGVVINPTCKR